MLAVESVNILHIAHIIPDVTMGLEEAGAHWPISRRNANRSESFATYAD